MDLKKLISGVFGYTCRLFTAMTAFYALIVTIMTVNQEIYLSGERIIMFFLFSLIFAIASYILKITSINSVIRYILHFAAIGLDVYFCLLMPADMQGSKIVVGIAFYTVIYLIVMAVRSIFRAKLKANLEKTEEYKSQFKK